MPTSLSYFSNKYRCHEQFAQHKSSFAWLTCRQSIYIRHVIVLNTLNVLANVFLEVYISHRPLWFHLIEWNHLVWQSHISATLQKNKTKKTKHAVTLTTKHIYTDQNKPIISTLRASGGRSLPRLSVPWCQSYPEASGGVEGYGLQKKIHHRWVSLCADMKRIQEQQK